MTLYAYLLQQRHFFCVGWSASKLAGLPHTCNLNPLEAVAINPNTDLVATLLFRVVTNEELVTLTLGYIRNLDMFCQHQLQQQMQQQQ